MHHWRLKELFVAYTYRAYEHPMTMNEETKEKKKKTRMKMRIRMRMRE